MNVFTYRKQRIASLTPLQPGKVGSPQMLTTLACTTTSTTFAFQSPSPIVHRNAQTFNL